MPPDDKVNQPKPTEALDYRSAGVDIEEGNRLVERIKQASARTARPEVLNAIGGFGALFELPNRGYRRPVLVSGTDGVGTKLKLAIASANHRPIGIDLVAMSVNDIITLGAEPLFFLDYFATSKLSAEIAAEVVEGIADGCEQAGAALIGGETAEMPGIYQPGDYDLAGFCVGVVEHDEIIDGSKVAAGDCLIALGSSGPHSNGYSLIRAVLDRAEVNLGDPSSQPILDSKPLLHHLMQPTRIYTRALRALFQAMPVHGAAHITGGGLSENIPRVLPPCSQAVLSLDDARVPSVFAWLQQTGNIATSEMRRTFNLGVGMVVIVSEDRAKQAIDCLVSNGESAWMLGHIESSAHDKPEVVYR